MQRIARAHLLGAETVELFVFNEELTVRERTVKSSHTVELVISGHQVVACVCNGLDVARGNVAGSADKGKVFLFHNWFFIIVWFNRFSFCHCLFRYL